MGYIILTYCCNAVFPAVMNKQMNECMNGDCIDKRLKQLTIKKKKKIYKVDISLKERSGWMSERY